MTVRARKYPIGVSDYKELIDENYTFIDKSFFIKEIIDEGAKVLLLPRPRRFGKTLNMSMLSYYFDCQLDTKELFKNLNISKAGAIYQAEQNKYPLIYLTLKDIKFETYDKSIKALHILISNLYKQFQAVWLNNQLTKTELEMVDVFIEKRASDVELSSAIYDLTSILQRIYNQKVIILLDEYDTPIINAYTKGYYEPMIDFMRVFLGKSLKDNPYLAKSVLTGILRVAKESIFSDLNNVKVRTLLDNQYSNYFGFTETEVEKLINDTAQSQNIATIRDWYNGYQMGNSLIYNPWSIIQCLDSDGELRPYWINTSDNKIIRNLIIDSDINIKADFELLLQGKTINKQIESQLSFKDLDNNSALTLWSFLTLCGYLSVASSKSIKGELYCELCIPNKEVYFSYRKFIKSWFIKRDPDNYQKFLENLVTGNIEDFSYRLSKYLSESPSFHDFNDSTPEQVYHSFVLGMVVGLSDTHIIKSNRESGFGRYDVMIIPNDKTKLGIIIEFKTVLKSKANNLQSDLEETAKTALAQIEAKNYAAELNQMGINNHLKLGIAFATKSCCVLMADK